MRIPPTKRGEKNDDINLNKSIDITRYINGKTMTQDIDISFIPESVKQKYAILICKVQKLNKARQNQTKSNLMIE